MALSSVPVSSGIWIRPPQPVKVAATATRFHAGPMSTAAPPIRPLTRSLPLTLANITRPRDVDARRVVIRPIAGTHRPRRWRPSAPRATVRWDDPALAGWVAIGATGSGSGSAASSRVGSTAGSASGAGAASVAGGAAGSGTGAGTSGARVSLRSGGRVGGPLPGSGAGGSAVGGRDRTGLGTGVFCRDRARIAPSLRHARPPRSARAVRARPHRPLN